LTNITPSVFNLTPPPILVPDPLTDITPSVSTLTSPPILVEDPLTGIDPRIKVPDEFIRETPPLLAELVLAETLGWGN
jgi:hypothetical protein